MSNKKQNPQFEEQPSQSESVERDGNQSTETSTPPSPSSEVLDSGTSDNTKADWGSSKLTKLLNLKMAQYLCYDALPCCLIIKLKQN